MSFSTTSLQDFIKQAASNAPTPGGGSVAALSGALGSAMASMAANFTTGNPKYAEHEETITAILKTLRPLIEDFRAAIDDDANAFATIADAYKLPRETEDQKNTRKAAIETALTSSMKVPLRILRCSKEASDLLPGLSECGNKNLLSDVMVSAIMLTASAKAALVNVHANSSQLKTDEARAAEAEGEKLVKQVEEIAVKVEEIIKRRN